MTTITGERAEDTGGKVKGKKREQQIERYEEGQRGADRKRCPAGLVEPVGGQALFHRSSQASSSICRLVIGIVDR